MKELVKINSENEQFPVNARDLYDFLGNGKQFADWMKLRIKQYDFIKDTDYHSLSLLGEKPQGGRPSIEYNITMDMAKELSMVENNAKGKEARRYFIEVEKDWRARVMPLTGIVPTEIAGRKFYYYYSVMQSMNKAYCQQALAAQINRNRQEFVKDASGWFVSHDYSLYMIAKQHQRTAKASIKQNADKMIQQYGCPVQLELVAGN